MYVVLSIIGWACLVIGGFMFGRGYYRLKWLKAVALSRQLAVAVEETAGSIGQVMEGLHEDNIALTKQNRALAERVAAQSELLSKAAEREKASEVAALAPDSRFREILARAEPGFLQILATMQAAEIREQKAIIKRQRQRIVDHETQMGCLFPRGLKTPPGTPTVVEDPLSATWAREVGLLEERG